MRLKPLYYAPIYVAAIAVIVFLACAPYGYLRDSYRFTVFEPYVAEVQGMQPFYLSGSRFFPVATDYYAQHGDADGYRRNVKEWKEYCGGDVSEEDLQTFLYHTEPDDVFHQLRLAEEKSGESASLLTIVAQNNKEALRYLEFAKKCEKLFSGSDPWQSYYYSPKDTLGLKLLREEGNKLLQQVKDPFLRQRYGYQLQKISYYVDDWEAVVSYYEDIIEPIPIEGVISEWGSYYYAIAVQRLGNLPRGNSLLAIAFDRSPDKRDLAVRAFLPEKLDSAAELVTEQRTKAILHVMTLMQYRGKGLQMLRKAHNYSPGLKYIDVALVREVNKIEDWIMTPRQTGLAPSFYSKENVSDWDSLQIEQIVKRHYTSDLSYTRQVVSFIDELIRTASAERKTLLHLCKAHLQYLLRDYEGAGISLQRASTFPAASDVARAQIQLTSILVETESANNLNDSYDEQLLQNLNWIRNNKNCFHNTERLLSQVQLVARNKYKEEHYFGRGLLLQPYITTHTTQHFFWYNMDVYQILHEEGKPEDIREILSILNSSRKNSLQQQLIDSFNWDKNKLYDLLGTLYLRIGNPKQAQPAFTEVEEQYWKEHPYHPYLDANPFKVDLYNPSGKTLPEEERWTKPLVVKRILELEQKAEASAKDRAYNYFLLANAWYNMSYYGNSWIMIKSYWSKRDRPTKNDRLDRIYFCTSKAKEYYLKAFEHAPNKKFASLCAAMAGKCEANATWAESGNTSNWRYSSRPLVPNAKYRAMVLNRWGSAYFYDNMTNGCCIYTHYIEELEY